MKNITINTIKKAFAGIFLFSLVLVMIGIGAKTANAYTFTQTMRLGSTGLEIMQLQKTLNTTVCKVALSGAGSVGFETTYFGLRTDAAVRCFQTAHGLGADGIVGPITRAALNGLVVIAPPSNLPAGCLPGYLFSATTGQSCLNPNLPAGCIPGYLFSPLTGQSCTTTPPPETPNDNLNGGSGEINSAVFVANLNNEQVGENQNNIEVAGLRIEAGDDSDIELTSVRLNFSQGTADRNFNRYAEEVTIWFDGRKIATVDADEFTSGDDYDRTISLNSGAIIRADQTKNLVIAISAQSNIDSTDEGETWSIEFESIRFRDGDNAVTTDSATGDIGGPSKTFSFENFATASDVELEIVTTSNNPTAKIVQADDNNDTNNVLLLAGEFQNNGDSNLDIQELTVRITPAGMGDASEIASSFTLVVNGSVNQTINADMCSIPTDCDGTGTNTAVEYVFDDVDFMLEAGTDANFEIRADINNIGGNVTEGDSLTAFVNADNIIADDETNEEVPANKLIGTISGNEQMFYTIFPEITVAGTSITYVGSSTDTANVSFSLNIKARGGNIYLNGDNETTLALQAFQASTLGGNANTTLSALVYTPSGNYTVVNNGAEDEYFVINSGNTMTLTLSGSLSQTVNTIPAGAEIDAVLFGTTSTDETTRSAKSIDFEVLMDQLETNLLTLIGA